MFFYISIHVYITFCKIRTYNETQILTNTYGKIYGIHSLDIHTVALPIRFTRKIFYELK